MTSEQAKTDTLAFNGVDVDSGSYLLPPLTIEDVTELAQGNRLDEDRLGLLKIRKLRSEGTTLGVVDEVNPSDLAQTGWGILFAHDIDPAPYLDALKPLLDLR